jgi:hypothetical protein
MDDEIKFITARYPAFKDKIIAAYHNSDEFKSLCEDLYSTSQILENYKEKVILYTSNELEYRTLLLDLENEVIKYLSAPNPGHKTK